MKTTFTALLITFSSQLLAQSIAGPEVYKYICTLPGGPDQSGYVLNENRDAAEAQCRDLGGNYLDREL